MASAQFQGPSNDNNAKKKIAEEYVKTELRQIQKRAALKPFPTGTLSLFENHQVWEKVLGYVKDPSHVANVMKICPAFEAVLKPRMISTILNILKEKKYIGLEDGVRNESVWNLRLVSKSWKSMSEAIFLDNFGKDWELDYLKTDFWELKIRPNVLRFVNPKDLADAMSILPMTGSPSVAAQVIYMEVSNFEGDTIAFLNVHGKSFEGLLWGKTAPGSLHYQSLLDFVSRTPNLKALVMQSWHSTQDEVNPSVEAPLPFPNLPSLELIRFDDKEDATVVLEMLKKSKNLKSIKFPNNLKVTEEVVGVLNKLPLENIFVQVLSDDALLIRGAWPLKRLIIENTDIPVSILFPLFNRFGKTLEHLELGRLGMGTITRAREEIKLQLPNLKVFSLKNANVDGSCLDFLIPFKSLVFLEVRELHHQNDPLQLKDTNQLLKVRGFENKLNESNIWTYFPNLKKIYIFGTLHGRNCSFNYYKKGNDVIQKNSRY